MGRFIPIGISRCRSCSGGLACDHTFEIWILQPRSKDVDQVVIFFGFLPGGANRIVIGLTSHGDGVTALYNAVVRLLLRWDIIVAKPLALNRRDDPCIPSTIFSSASNSCE
jgi:hypothetical protein